MRLFKRRGSTADIPDAAEEIAGPELPAPPDGDINGRRSVEEQRDYLLSLVSPLPAFGMYLLDAWGAAVCEDIIAENNLPGDDLVAVNGYAVRADDIAPLGLSKASTLKICPPDGLLLPGSAVRVYAGQVLPDGTDAVIADCDVTAEGDAIVFTRGVKVGDHVHWSGSEARAGLPIVRSGEFLDARSSALLALAGIDRVLARPRPRVVVLSISDSESVRADVESPLLAALVKSDGAQVWRVSNAHGTDHDLQNLISDQLIRADLLLISGNLERAGQLARVVSSMGLLDIADVALKPGGRVGFALVGEDKVPLVLLPDDPVDSYIDYQFFVQPLICALMGTPVANRLATDYIAGGDFKAEKGTVSVFLGTVRIEQGERIVVPLGDPDHPRLSDLVDAGALVVLDEAGADISLGDRVGCWPLVD